VTDEEVQRVLDSIDALGTDGDAAERAKRLTALLDGWPDTHARVRALRQQAVQELHRSGMSYRKIGELLGVSFGRVRQIIDGETAGPAKRKRAAAEDSSAAE
jgi:DNA-directed RNA polymerase specialized sigma24 family protein